MFCPARSAGVLNRLTRKIVFVRACVRPSVRPSVPYFLIMILQLFISYLEIDEINKLRLTSNWKSDDLIDFQIRSETLQNHNKEMGYTRTHGRTHGQRRFF